MQLQQDSAVDFKTKVKTHFAMKKYQKFLTIGGLGAAALQSVGFHNTLLSLTSFTGEIAGALAIHQMFNREPTVAKSAFLTVGGLALSAVTSVLPFTPLIHQVTGTITAAGVGGFINLGLNKINGKKMKI